MEEPLSAKEALAFSHHLADQARSLTLRYFRTSFDIARKTDESIVTTVDQKVESELRRLIRERFPDHGIIGEEYGRISGTSSWVLDPIDGTTSLVLGNPLFGTLIGLLHADQAFVGLIDIPVMGERWAGDGKHTVFFNGPRSGPAAVAGCKTLDQARLYIELPDFLRTGQGEKLYSFIRQTAVSHSSCDCYAYGLLASGYCDLVIEDDLEPYDYLPIVPIVLGAGGCMTDWEGKSLGLNSGGRVVAAATQPLLYDAISALKSFC